jgi:hypothetical protein
MILTKGGITIEVFHPSDIDRYKRLDYVKPEESKPVEVVAPVEPVAPIAPELTQQEKDQAEVEKTLQPAKKGKKS